MHRASIRSLVTLSLLMLSACSGDSSSTAVPAAATLTIKGSGSPAPGASGSIATSARLGPQLSADAVVGTPGSLTVGMHAFYIGTNADCSGLVEVQSLGGVAQPKDLMQNPVLFAGSPPNGSYRCVAMRISDVIRMKPATSFGPCVAGTEYAGDIYRAGENDFKDVDGSTIIAHGTDEVPVSDVVAIFMTREPAAALARGISSHQTIALGSNLVVPGQSTFYWDATGSITTDGGGCNIQPGRPSFQ